MISAMQTYDTNQLSTGLEEKIFDARSTLLHNLVHARMASKHPSAKSLRLKATDRKLLRCQEDGGT